MRKGGYLPRYTIDLGDPFDSALAELAKQKSTTKAEIIRRAIVVYAALQREAHAGKRRKVSITTENDEIVKEIVIP